MGRDWAKAFTLPVPGFTMAIPPIAELVGSVAACMAVSAACWKRRSIVVRMVRPPVRSVLLRSSRVLPSDGSRIR